MIRFEEFEIQQLYTLQPIRNMLSKNNCDEYGIFPVCSSDTTNNGIIGYCNNPEFIIDDNNPVYITFGDHTRTCNIMQNSFSVIDNTKVLIPKIKSIKALIYINTVWKKSIKNLGYARHWKIAKDCKIKLPIIVKNNIPIIDEQCNYHKKGYLPNINYMEKYISELEEERISELEEERISELTAYLKVSGLENYILTQNELNAINDLKNNKIKFVKFDITGKNGIFDVKNTHSILQEWIIPNSGTVPYVTAGTGNNSIVTYITPKAEWIEEGNSIMIGGKTLVITYQKDNYVSNDSHNLGLYLKDNKHRTENVHLFLISALYKSLKSKYEWGASISKTKIQKDTFKLPVDKDGNIDYTFMETYIEAIKKLSIKSVVEWKDKQIEVTKQIVNTK